MYKKSKEQLIKFEDKIFDLFESGDLPYLTHLNGGNEDQLIDIFKSIKDDDWVFSTHRNHYHYLLKAGNEDRLLENIKNGDSMFVYDKENNFFSSSIVAGSCGIAVGVAQGIKLSNKNNHVWCFVGDGASELGHFYEAVRFVDGFDLPCTFIIEDNDRSVDATKLQRIGQSKMNWPKCVIRYEFKPIYPHIGTGTGRMVKFKEEIIKRYQESKKIC